MKPSLGVALAAYAAFALIAIFALNGLFRTAVLILLGAFALKTWIAHAAGWSSSSDSEHEGSDRDHDWDEPSSRE